jgi:PAS domain S-box-containing protein
MREDHPAAPGEKKASSKGKAFSSIQGMLVRLLLLVLVPILLAQTYFSYDRYQNRKGIESEANLNLARASAKAFDTFVQDVLHQELTIGLAFTSSQTLSDKEKRRILFDSQAGNPAIWHLFWENPAGIVTAATGSQFIGMDLSDREYYRKIVAGKEWVVSDLILSKTTQQPSFTISRGVRNERGELLGIIVAGILPAKLDRVLAVERPGDAGVSLLDSKGMHAYRYPATTYTWEQRNWLKHYPIIGEVLKGKEVVPSLVSGRTGINRIVAFTPVPSIGWIAASSRAEEEVVGPIISAALQETGLILLVAFVSLLTAVALSRTISTSVISLRDYALSLGQGETQNPLTISRPAEIKDLAEAFNKMAEEISSREKALRESDQRYSALFANKINGMAHCRSITDEHGHPVDYVILQINEAYERIIGVKKADIEGLRVTVVFPDITEYALDYIGMYGKVALESGEIKFEDYFEATGQCLSIYAYSPLPGEFIAIFTDVTERKQAEAALRLTQESIDCAAEMVAWFTPDGTIHYVNDATCRTLGYSRDELLQMTALDFSPGFTWEQYREHWREVRERKSFTLETTHRRKDGSEYPAEVLVNYLLYGGQEYIFAYGRDITERKLAEESLQESEERYRTLFETMTEGFSLDEIILDDAGNPVDLRYLSVNPAFELHTGLKAEDIVGRTTCDLFPEAEPVWFERYGKVALTGEPVHFEEQFGPLNKWFEVSAFQTEPGRFAVVFYDITERKQAEEQIKASLAEKEVMLKEIHHRVKNNLQVISSLVSLQADGTKDEVVRQVLQDVIYRVRSMALVHEKLYQSANLAHIDFAEYTRSLLSYLWRAHGAVAISVRQTFDLESVSLPVDTAVTCGLIMNELAVNALEHAFQDRADGEVTVSLHSGANGQISLCVADNGVGLPKDFDWRQSGSLGLRLVQMLSRQLDATVEVKSEDGTKFELVFENPVSSPLLS